VTYYQRGREVLVSVATEGGERIEFIWFSDPNTENRGARVVRTDKYGQRWQLDIPHTYVVTQRVAAGLLNVSLVTVNKWVREGKFGRKRTRNGVSVIPMAAVERIALERGIEVPR
jgi:hypothetical protein